MKMPRHRLRDSPLSPVILILALAGCDSRGPAATTVLLGSGRVEVAAAISPPDGPQGRVDHRGALRVEIEIEISDALITGTGVCQWSYKTVRSLGSDHSTRVERGEATQDFLITGTRSDDGFTTLIFEGCDGIGWGTLSRYTGDWAVTDGDLVLVANFSDGPWGHFPLEARQYGFAIPDHGDPLRILLSRDWMTDDKRQWL